MNTSQDPKPNTHTVTLHLICPYILKFSKHLTYEKGGNPYRAASDYAKQEQEYQNDLWYAEDENYASHDGSQVVSFVESFQ